MSGIRGRNFKVGGVALQPQGGAARTETTTSGDAIARPAFRFSAGAFKPTVPSSFTGALDPHSVLFWRLVLVGAAALYIAGYHVRVPILGRIRV